MNHFYMVTIKAKRWITAGLTLVSTGVYSYDASTLNPLTVFIDGVEIGQSSTMVTNADGAWYLNESTGVIYLGISAADVATPVNVVIYHTLNYTNNLEFYYDLNPDGLGDRVVLYQSRLKGRPQFTQSQQNNLVGLVSISMSSISFINDDQGMNHLFSKRDSFKDSEIRIWKCEDTAATRTAFYIGYITSASLGKTVTFGLNDFFTKLDAPIYTINSSLSQSTNLSNSTMGSTITSLGATLFNPEDSSKPIYKLYGRNSGFKTRYNSEFFRANQDVFLECDGASMPEAVCIERQTVLATNVNRLWATGIIEDISGYEETFTVASVTTVTSLGYDYLRLGFTGIENVTVGDTLEINGDYVQCISVLSAAVFGTQYIYVIQNNVTIVVGETIKLHKISNLTLVTPEGDNLTLFYIRDYTVNAYVDQTRPIVITLVNNCEAVIKTGGLGRPIDPNSDKLYYKMRNVKALTAYDHAYLLKKVLLIAMLDEGTYIDTASFTAADAALDLDLAFTTPFVGRDFITVRQMIEKILPSSFGYLYINDSFQISYGNYLTSGGSYGEITEIEIEADSISHSVDYKDVYYKTSFINDQFSGSYQLVDLEPRYLHEDKRTQEYEQVCDTVSLYPNYLPSTTLAQFAKIANFFAFSKVITSFNVLDFSIKIGDRKSITSSKSIGASRGTVVSTSEGDMVNSVSIAQVEENESQVFWAIDELIYTEI